MKNFYRALALPALIAPLFAWSVLTVNVEVTHQTCFYANGGVQALAFGGTPPYTYEWNTGSTNQSLFGVSAGTYSVTVTDALSEQVIGQGEVFSLPYQLEGVISGMPWCTSPRNAFEDPMVSGTTNTWTVNGLPTTLSGGGFIQFDTNPFDSFYSYPVDDGNGCTGTVTGTNGPQITNWPALTLTDVDPSCDIANIGAIQVTATAAVDGGIFGPYISIDRLDGPPVFQAYSVSSGALVVDFTDLPPGAYAIHWWLGVTGEDLDPGLCGYDSLLVTVPSVGANCGSVQGISYIDLDGDCTQDANEAGIPYSPLLVQPGNEAVLTDGSGQFAFGLANGSYTLEQTDPTLVPICPLPQPFPFTVSSNISSIELANSSTEPLDLRVGLAGTVFRPGFNTQYHVFVHNDSPQQSGPVTVTLELDPTLVFVSSTVAESNVSGNTVTWDLPAFTSFQAMQWYVTVQTPVGTALGILLNSTLTVSNTLPEGDLVNNTHVDVDIVVGSYDPNDKRAQTSTRASNDLYFINEDEWIDYTIRFQNTGTFPAEFVVITDTIPAELDMLSFEQGVASHLFIVSFKPGRVIEWRFDDIQLPDSTSDEPGSHGLVKFRMRPVLPLLAGTVIENVASIFFDFNPPVITEPSVLTAEFSTGQQQTEGPAEVAGPEQLSVIPDPAIDRVRLLLPAGLSYPIAVEVLTLDGRPAMRLRLEKDAEFDVSGLAAGTYLVRAKYGAGVTGIRFVKR